MIRNPLNLNLNLPTLRTMQRAARPPRNRQPRPPRNNNNNHQQQHPSSRPSTFPSSAATSFSRPSYPFSVPTISQVQPNAHVSIVLKVDQATGRQVRGVVADVLTKGDHPRGIKVRLRDGRVGRVQGMVAGSEGDLRGLIGTESNVLDGGGGRVGGRQGGSMVVNHEELPRAGYSLGDFLPKGHPLRDGEPVEPSGAANSQDGGAGVDSGLRSNQRVGDMQKCPICGDFEDDGSAVEHHVNTAHFGD